MKSIGDMEHCSIIGAVCPYEYGCRVCRLHNDYEEAREKSQKITRSFEGNAEQQAEDDSRTG